MVELVVIVAAAVWWDSEVTITWSSMLPSLYNVVCNMLICNFEHVKDLLTLVAR